MTETKNKIFHILRTHTNKNFILKKSLIHHKLKRLKYIFRGKKEEEEEVNR